MVSITTIGKSFDGLVRYQYEGRRDQPTDKQAEILMSSGVSIESAAEMISDFNLGKAVNPKLGYPVWHTSLSFNPDDAARLDSAKMLAIAEGYLQKMGLDNTQYVIVRHHDQPDHQHLHIIANRVDYDGKTIDDGRNFYRSKLALQELVAEHGLTPPKGKRPELQHPERLRGTDLARHEMLATVNQTLAVESQRPQLLAALRAAGLGVEERFDKAGRAIGISFEKDGYKVKGSELGRHLSSASIDKQLAANALKQQADVTASDATTVSQLLTLATPDSKMGEPSASPSLEKVGSMKLPQMPVGQISPEESVSVAAVREAVGDGQSSPAAQQVTTGQDRLEEQAVAAVAAVQREKKLIADYEKQANQADRRDDVERMVELRFETIPAAQKRLAAYEAEVNSTPVGRELLAKQKELQPEKVQNDEIRTLAGPPVVSVIPEPLETALPVQQPVALAGRNDELTIAKATDHSQESVPAGNLSERETKGVVAPQYAAEAAQRQADEEMAKEALAGMRREQALIAATEKEADLAERRGDYGKVAELRYGLLKEIEQRLTDYQTQAEATPVGRRLLAEQVQAQEKTAKQAILVEQAQKKAVEARAAEEQVAEVAVRGVSRERALLEASGREAVQAEQQGRHGEATRLRSEVIPQAERRLADYERQAAATAPGRELLKELNAQEKARQLAIEVLSQVAAKRGFISREEFDQKAAVSGYHLPTKLDGQPQQVVERSSGRRFEVPLLGDKPFEKVIAESIWIEESMRTHQKTEMDALEEARGRSGRGGKEVVRIRVDAAQVEPLQRHIGRNMLQADAKPGADGRVGLNIVYNPNSNDIASVVSRVVTRVRASGGEVFEQAEEALRRERSANAFQSNLPITLEKKEDREIGS
jgi:hypothetical protein